MDAATIRAEMQAKAKARAAGCAHEGTSSTAAPVQRAHAGGGVDVQSIRAGMQAKAAARARNGIMSAAARKPHSEAEAATTIQAAYRARSTRRIAAAGKSAGVRQRADRSDAAANSYDVASIRETMQQQAARRASALGITVSPMPAPAASIASSTRTKTGYDAASFKASMERRAAQLETPVAAARLSGVRWQSDTEAATMIQANYRGHSARTEMNAVQDRAKGSSLGPTRAQRATDSYTAASIRASIKEKAAAQVRGGTSSVTCVSSAACTDVSKQLDDSRAHISTIQSSGERNDLTVVFNLQDQPSTDTPRVAGATAVSAKLYTKPTVTAADRAAGATDNAAGSVNCITRSVSAPASRAGTAELQKEAAVLLIQHQVRRRSKRTVAAMIAEEERWHQNQRANLINSLDFLDQMQQSVAEEEDASIQKARIRTETWKECHTGSALDAAMFVAADRTHVARDGAAATSKTQLRRSASYTEWQQNLPVKASERPWIAHDVAATAQEVSTRPLSTASPRLHSMKPSETSEDSAALVEWQKEKATWETERWQMREEAQAQAAEIRSMRNEMRRSIAAATAQETSTTLAKMRDEWQQERESWDAERRSLHAEMKAQAAEIESLRQSLRSNPAGRGAAASHTVSVDSASGKPHMVLPALQNSGSTVQADAETTTRDEEIQRVKQSSQRRKRRSKTKRAKQGQRRQDTPASADSALTRNREPHAPPSGLTEPEPEPEPELEPKLKQLTGTEPAFEGLSTYASISNHTAQQQRRLSRRQEQPSLHGEDSYFQPWALPSPRSLFRHRYLSSIGLVDSPPSALHGHGVERQRRPQHQHPGQALHRGVAIDAAGARPRLVMSGFGRVSM